MPRVSDDRSLWIVSIGLLASCASCSRSPEPSAVEPPTIASAENQAFRLTISAPAAEFTPGDPIVLTWSLRNLADQPVEFVWQGLTESLHMQATANTWLSCGNRITDHPPGFEDDRTVLDAWAEVSISVDVTRDCLYAGRDTYKVWASYCHHEAGRIHGMVDADWCLTTEEFEIHVRDLGAALGSPANKR